MQSRKMIQNASVALLIVSLLVGCSAPAQTPTTSTIPSASSTPTASATPTASITSSATPTSGATGRVPLADALATLQPAAVWQNFYDLTKVPRPSHHEEQTTAFMAGFGRTLGLETIVDDAGNVIIRKPAKKGMEERPGAERMPGRRGDAPKTDWILFPLSFREFLARTAPQRDWQDVPSIDEVLAEPEKLDILRSLWLLGSSNLQTMLETYLQVGGFPPAVESFLQAGKVEPKVRNVYLSVVRLDIEKHRRNRVILKNLMARLIQTEGSPQSWQNLARDLGEVSYHTVQDFTETLADSFLLYLVRALDRSHGVASPRKEKKVYFADPFLRSALCEEQGLAGISLGLQVEAAVGSHLLRLFEREPEEGWSLLKQVYYWRSARGQEVDYVIHRPSGDLPVEVKYQGSIQASDLATMRRSFGSGILITKQDVFFRDGIFGVPAAVFLLLERT